MARTNRVTAAAAAAAAAVAPVASTNVDALDNIDLDDMFADDGDALFDGLDIDLDNMDDITGDTTKKADSSHSKTSLAIELEEDVVAVTTKTTSSTRTRTTKRKSRYDDDEDSYYKPTAQPTTKRSKTKTSSTAAVPPPPIPKATTISNNSKDKSKSKTKGLSTTSSKSKNSNKKEEIASKTLPQPKEPSVGSSNKSSTTAATSTKTTSTSVTSKTKFGLRATALPMAGQQRMLSVPATSVAAAGQFGGRLPKRAASSGVAALTSSVLPKSSGISGANKNKLPLAMRSSSQSSTTISSSIAASNDTLKKTKQQHSKQQQAVPKSSSLPLSQQQQPPPSQQPSLMKQKPKHTIPKREYCGLKADDTVFYPFMPTLPSEPTLKSRKAYGIIDKIHSTLLNYLANPIKYNSETSNSKSGKNVVESDPIFQLLLEAYKSDEKQPGDDSSITAGSKPTQQQEANAMDNSNSSSKFLDANKKEILGNSIRAIRKIVKTSDKDKLIDDLLSVISLLHTQYDFLIQNEKNMQKWCFENFNAGDYSSVYKSKSQPGGVDEHDKVEGEGATKIPLVLESFRRREIKVKIICDGFKEPTINNNNNSNKSSSSSLPIALLPPRYAPPPPPITPAQPKVLGTDKNKMQVPPMGITQSAATNKSKKRKLSISSTSAPTTGTKVLFTAGSSTSASLLKSQHQPAVTYSTLETEQRRQCISDLLSKTARELEMNYIHRTAAERKQWLDRHDSNIRRFFADEDGIQNQHQHPPPTPITQQQSLPLTATTNATTATDIVKSNPITIIHTTGMWRYMERSGYVTLFTPSDMQRLNEIYGEQEPSMTVVTSKKSNMTSSKIIRSGTEDIIAKRNDSKSSPWSTKDSQLQNNLGNVKNHDTSSLLYRIQSLLVEEDDEGDEDQVNSDQEGDDKNYNDNGGHNVNHNNYKTKKKNSDEIDFDIIEDMIDTSEKCADLSALSFDERAFLHLKGFGLAKKLTMPSQPQPENSLYTTSNLSNRNRAGKNMIKEKKNDNDRAGETLGSSTKVGSSLTKGQAASPLSSPSLFRDDRAQGGGVSVSASYDAMHTNGTKKEEHFVADIPVSSAQGQKNNRSSSHRPSELDSIIDSMTTDLTNVVHFNHRRASYLESVAKSCPSLSVEESKRMKEEEANVITKCRTLLAKSKAELMKAKSESKAKANSDDLLLPW